MSRVKCVLCGHDVINPHQDIHNDTETYDCKICGKVSGTLEWMDDIKENSEKRLLSGFTYNNNQGKKPFIFTNDNFSDVIQQIKNYSVQYKLDSFLINFSKKTKFPGERINIYPDTHFPLAFSLGADEFIYYLKHLLDVGFIEGSISNLHNGFYLTVKGFARVEELEKGSIKSNFAFVAMSFDEEDLEIFNNGLKPAIEACDYEARRVDSQEHNEKIDDKIIADIKMCAFLVADFTKHKKGVYFEAGFAMGLGKEVIYCCKKDHMDECHFDIRQYNIIVWENYTMLQEKLTNRIKAVIPLYKQPS